GGTVAAAFLGFFTQKQLHAASAYLDALVTTQSVVAQWLLSRKNLSTWSFWILVDALALFLFASQRLWLTTGLYAVLLAMVIAGLFEWRRAWLAQATAR